MANQNEPIIPNKDPEYHFSEEEYVSETVSKTRSGLMSKLLSRKVLVPVLLIAAVFVVYQFVGKPRQPRKEIKASEQQTLQSVAPTTTVSAPVIQPTLGVQTSDQLSAVTQQIAQNQQQIQQLQLSLQQLQSSMVQLSNQIASLNANVSNMTQVSKTPQVVRPITYVRKKPAPRPLTYRVRAIVPGLAWLQSNGKVITVRQGDFLPGYGRIQRISAREGKVWTSWGTVFSYRD